MPKHERRATLQRRHTKLLCPDCEELKLMKQYSDKQLYCVLECGHVREFPLLPPTPGSVGLENILQDDQLAAKWFPFALDTPKRRQQGEEPSLEEAAWEQSVRIDAEDTFAEKLRQVEAAEAIEAGLYIFEPVLLEELAA